MTRLPVDLSCRELVELVTEYLEAKLPADERTRFELHLGYCGPCRTYLEQLRQVLSASGRLTEDELAPEVQASLLGAFRAWKAGGR